MANIVANPAVTVHTPLGNHAGNARVVGDREFRRRVFSDPDIGWDATQAALDRLVDTAPMVQVVFD